MKRTDLKSAHQRIVDFFLEQLAPGVVVARPAPEVLAVAVRSAALQNGGCDDPHDGVEDEEAERERGVVDGGLFGFAVTASAVRPEDEERGG